MADQQFVMTQKNYDDLKKELDYLVKVKRPEIIERIAEARSHGDLSENAEYDAAREEQRSNEGKIAELEYQIKNADVREEVNDNSYVHLNSVVKVYDSDMEEEAVYTITSVTDVDVMNGKISVESPVGAALLKKKKGDTVTVSCPDGSSYTLKILSIK
ncbi:MAG: transcription elongation factor GreA [Clostridia bacterium]|nr:transcription elongation factor GreA [Clostridia bacterium]MDE7305779.1 transcription elongation factor GreA [Clostridia bacterium]